jgi:hypothetical protein
MYDFNIKKSLKKLFFGCIMLGVVNHLILKFAGIIVQNLLIICL